MKKYGLFIIVFLLLISGCTVTTNEKFFLSFEGAEAIALENIHFLLNENSSLFEFQNYSVQCDVKSDDENMKLDADISFSGFLDEKKSETLEICPDITFFDKKKFTGISTSGLIQNLYYKNQYYTEFSGFFIDMGKGNYESNLRDIIINNLSGKWIKYDSEKIDGIRQTQKDIKFLLNTLSSSRTFENLEQVSYEGYNAYRISIKSDILNYIKNQTNIEITNFDGLFIIRSKDQIDLKINNMDVVYTDNLGTKNFVVNGIIGEDNGILNFSKNEENIEISFEMHRKYTKISISKFINFNQIWSLTTNISKTKKENTNNFNIKSDVKISPIVIYGSDLEKELEINIKCLYENFSGETFSLKEPDSYVLLEQILGDEFSIKNFIGNK